MLLKEYKYKNLTLLAFGIVMAIFLARSQTFRTMLLGMHVYGYIGAFVGGVLFVLTLTVPVGIVIFLELSQKLNTLVIAVAGGAGAVVGDLVIFRLVRRDILSELKYFFAKFRFRRLKKVFRSRYFKWALPLFGAIIIASPLPDELGVSLMGLSHIKTSQFIILSFVLNTIGIFLIISVVAGVR